MIISYLVFGFLVVTEHPTKRDVITVNFKLNYRIAKLKSTSRSAAPASRFSFFPC